MTYGYKGFLLLFCTCLAWETRKVYMPALNDSKQIGFAVYNVFIPCSIIIPLLNLLKSNSNAVYTLSALLCIFCTTITQCLIFLPKVSRKLGITYFGKTLTSFEFTPSFAHSSRTYNRGSHNRLAKLPTLDNWKSLTTGNATKSLMSKRENGTERETPSLSLGLFKFHQRYF